MTSPKKAIQIIDKQIKKLDVEPFDLEAWKSGSQSILEMLFGVDHTSIAQIKSLKVDYSSWALRDATAKYNPISTCKLKGKELLESAKDQIELFGINQDKPEERKRQENPITIGLSTAEKKKLVKALSHEVHDKKLAEIKKVVSKWKPERQIEILSELLLSKPEFTS